MAIKNQFVRAYQQAPWRIYTQNSALFLIGVFLIACVVWIMLTVSVQASEAGLDIQVLTSDQMRLMREIADTRSQIAMVTSSEQMGKKAEAMGFRPAEMKDLTFIEVSGYAGRQPEISAPPPGDSLPPMLIKPGYTQSLSDWLWQGVVKLSAKPGVQIP